MQLYGGYTICIFDPVSIIFFFKLEKRHDVSRKICSSALFNTVGQPENFVCCDKKINFK